MEQRLPDVNYLSFPFRIAEEGGRTSGRMDHVREQIEQVLFTEPGERVFRPEFGAGIHRLVFETNSDALALVTTRRLRASLEESLRGEVDPRSLEIDIRAHPEFPERIVVEIAYALPAVNHSERLKIESGG